MMLINGCATTQLAAADRGLQFGDGCFTTARVVNGEVVWLEAHLQRLQQACLRLRIAFSERQTLAAEMQQLAQGQAQAVLKVIITRGAGGRGYSPAGCSALTRLLSLSPYPAHYPALREQGARLSLVSTPLGINPALAGIKHLNRLEQVLIRSELDERGGDEALVLDSDGWLVECCAANLFWRKGNQLFTPDLSRCGVDGLARQQLLRDAAELGLMIAQVRETPATLQDADEVLITNALMPLLPVRQIGQQHYSSRSLWQRLATLNSQWT